MLEKASIGYRAQSSCPQEMLIARTPGEVEALRPAWEGLLAAQADQVINADPRRYLSVIAADGSEPFVACSGKAGAGHLLLGYKNIRPLPVRIGYKTLFQPRVSCLNVEYQGLLGPAETAPSFLAELLARVAEEVEVVFFNHLRVDSPVFRQLRGLGAWRRDSFFKSETHWRMAIPAGMDDFYQPLSSKHRNNLRRLVKKLEGDFPQLEVRLYTQTEDVDRAVAEAGGINEKTYQGALGVGVGANDRTRSLLQVAAREGWFRGYLLYLEGAPAAYQFALKYGRVYFGESVGFDPKWRDYRVGTYLFLRVLEELCRSGAIDFYDFGFGDAEYKRNYSSEHWQEASLCVFSPRLYPLAVNICRNSVQGASRAAEWLLRRTGLEAWVKRRWRDRLQEKQQSETGILPAESV